MNRVFYNGNESHSRNLGVDRRGGVITDVVRQPSPSLPSQERRAYDSYVAMSRSIGAPIMPFEKWYAKDSGIGTTFDGDLRFHGHSLASLSEWSGVRSSLFGSSRASFETSGGHDNAVRALEDEPHSSDMRSGWER